MTRACAQFSFVFSPDAITGAGEPISICLTRPHRNYYRFRSVAENHERDSRTIKIVLIFNFNHSKTIRTDVFIVMKNVSFFKNV